MRPPLPLEDMQLWKTRDILLYKILAVHSHLSLKKEVKEEKVKIPYTTKIFEFNSEEASGEQTKRFEHLIDQFYEGTINDI